MPIAFRTVTQSKNTIRFGSRVTPKILREFVPILYDVVGRGYTEVVLDFRRSERAYPDAMLSIICLLDHRRARGDTFKVLLPEAANLCQLFLNANWAHYMDATHPKIDMAHPRHLAARRYSTHAEQQAAVDSAVDVVLRSLELRRDVIQALEWSVNEITDNVLNHAESSEGGIVQVSTFRDDHKITFVVADAGRGIPGVMREAFPHLRNDVDAINEAVKAGVTSSPNSGQGNGLAGSLRIATCSGGSFMIASGKARLAVFKDRSGKYRTQTAVQERGYRFPGTVVMLELSTQGEFDISEALQLGGSQVEVADVVDLRYATSTGELVLRLRDESLGFGTRHAGVELRRKCLNLLAAEPDKRLILDWSGVPLVSSSFADEGVGKLFVELGPTVFSARVTHANAETLVRSLLDRAVLQRVAQSMVVGTNEPTPD